MTAAHRHKVWTLRAQYSKWCHDGRATDFDAPNHEA